MRPKDVDAVIVRGGFLIFDDSDEAVSDSHVAMVGDVVAGASKNRRVFIGQGARGGGEVIPTGIGRDEPRSRGGTVDESSGDGGLDA